MKTKLFSTTATRGMLLAITIALLFASQQRLESEGTDLKRETIDVQLVGTVFPCSESAVELCADGVIANGPLKGSKEAIYTGGALSAGIPGVEPPTTFSYSGTQVFHTERGDLDMSVIGVQDMARLVFTEIARVTGGTGRYTGATGNFFISGTVAPDGTSFDSRITGEIRLDRSSP